MSAFSDDLLKWWRANGRYFPWRSETDSYRILLAEVMLRRTRAENVVKVYGEFLRSYPNIQRLSQSNPSDVVEKAGALGLKWRTNQLIEAAKMIENEMGGIVPIEKEKLLLLPGVGDYIASAVRVFSGGCKEVLIDTNTVRVIRRKIGKPYSDSLRRNRKIRVLYARLMRGSPSKEFGFGMIDLAAKICIPVNPKCEFCPVVKHCKTGKRATGTRRK